MATKEKTEEKEGLQYQLKKEVEEERKLAKRIKKYVKLNPEYTTAKAFITDLIEKELGNKTLDNTFIELDKPFYFNKYELFNNYTTIATTKKPKANTEEFIKIIKIPNNLDIYNTEFNSYCYDNNKNKHLGIDLYINPTKEALEKLPDKELTKEDFRINYITFEYDTEENIIEVDIISPLYIRESIDTKKHTELFKGYKKDILEMNKAINSDFNNTKELSFKHYLEDINLKYTSKSLSSVLYNRIINYSGLIIDFYKLAKENEEFFKEFVSYELKNIKLIEDLTNHTSKIAEEDPEYMKDYYEAKEVELEEMKWYLEDIKEGLLNKNEELFYKFVNLTNEINTNEKGVKYTYDFLVDISPLVEDNIIKISIDSYLDNVFNNLEFILFEDKNIYNESDLEEIVKNSEEIIDKSKETIENNETRELFLVVRRV